MREYIYSYIKNLTLKLKPYDYCLTSVIKTQQIGLIFMSNEKNVKKEMVSCCVMNCQREIPKQEAIVIKEKQFCPICGVA